MTLWLLALGCTTPASPAEDARVFADVLSNPRAPGAMAACSAIVDTNTQGECQLKVALNTEDRAAACGEVRKGLYRDECYFLASEGARRKGDIEAAVSLCRGAGVFLPDCQQHLWQGDLRRVMMGRSSFSARYLLAKEVYCDWSEEVGESEGYEDRFWDKAWNTALAGDKVMNIAPCSELNPTQAERCQKSGAHLLAARLDEVMVHADARETLCQGGLPDLDVLYFEPDPILDAVIERHRNAVCVEGLERPAGRNALETTPDPAKLKPEVCD